MVFRLKLIQISRSNAGQQTFRFVNQFTHQNIVCTIFVREKMRAADFNCMCVSIIIESFRAHYIQFIEMDAGIGESKFEPFTRILIIL